MLSAINLLKKTGNPIIVKNFAGVTTVKPTSIACFSAAAPSKEALFNELIETANGISDYNFKNYFVRRATEDKEQMDQFSVEELQERVDQMHRIRTVQNLYLSPDQRNVIETKRAMKQ